MEIELISRAENARPDRPALLFVHGGFHGAWCWDAHFLPWFAQRGWAAHALSLRGHAGSDGAAGIRRFSLADYAEDVIGACDRIGGRAVLIGHSLGGVVAQRCFRDRRDVAGLVLFASSPLRPARSTVLRLLRRRPVSLVLGQLLSHPGLQRRALEPMLFADDLDPALRETYRAKLCVESPRAIAELFSREPPDVPADESRPVLVIAGEDDWSIPLASHEALAATFRGPLRVCPGAHDLMLDPRWEASATAVESWLRSVFDGSSA